MKKLLLLLLIFVSVSLTPACGQDPPSSTTSTETATVAPSPTEVVSPVTDQEEVKLGVSQPQENNNNLSSQTSDNTTVNEPYNDPVQNQDKKDVTVYTTRTGSKYHSSGCRYLSKSCISISLDKAINNGLEPCSKCNPPE